MFWHKKNLTSEEHDKLSVRITDLYDEVHRLKTNLQENETLLRSLRGLVNRKLSGDSFREEEESAKEEEEKDINNPVILPEDGVIRRNRRHS